MLPCVNLQGFVTHYHSVYVVVCVCVYLIICVYVWVYVYMYVCVLSESYNYYCQNKLQPIRTLIERATLIELFSAADGH